MAHLFRSARNDFFTIGPANEIRETQYGHDANNVYYPGVSSCTTVTLLLDDQTLLGMHLAKPDPVAAVDALVAQMNVVRGTRTVRKLLVVGKLRVRLAEGFMGVARYAWPSLLTTFNTAFGRAAGAVVLGHHQEALDCHYRVQAAGGDAAVCYASPGSQPLGSGGWEAVQLSAM